MSKFLSLCASVFISTLIFIGCAKQLYIKADKDPEWEYNKEDPIFISLPISASVEQKKFKAKLERHLTDKGVIVPKELGAYVLTFQYHDKSGTTNGTLFLPNTTTTYGNIGGTNYTESSTSTQAIPYTSHYSFRKVYLNLYRTTEALAYLKNETKSLSAVWEGFCSIDSDFYEENEDKVLSACLNSIGMNFEGDVNVWPGR